MCFCSNSHLKLSCSLTSIPDSRKLTLIDIVHSITQVTICCLLLQTRSEHPWAECYLQMNSGNAYPDWVVLWFSSFAPDKCRDNAPIRPRQLSSKSFPVHNLSITLPFDVIRPYHRCWHHRKGTDEKKANMVQDRAPTDGEPFVSHEWHESPPHKDCLTRKTLIQRNILTKAISSVGLCLSELHVCRPMWELNLYYATVTRVSARGLARGSTFLSWA
jgi:hypothetical protein